MATDHQYEVRMGFGFGFAVPFVSKIPVVGKYAGFQVTEYIIEDMLSREKAIYAFASRDGAKGLPWIPVTVNLASSSSRFRSRVDIQEFAGKVFIKGAATGERSMGASMQWLDGKAKGVYVVTSGWQISTPGVGGSYGYLTLRDVYVPSSLAWDRAIFTLNIWRLILDLPGNYIKDGVVEHWGTLTIDATKSHNWLSSVPTYSWQWQSANFAKASHLPDWLLGSRTGVTDPAEDNHDLILHEGNLAGSTFLSLTGGASIFSGNDTPVVPNNAAGIRSLVGQSSGAGGLGVAQGSRHNGTLFGAKTHPIIWALTKREKVTN